MENSSGDHLPDPTETETGQTVEKKLVLDVLDVFDDGISDMLNALERRKPSPISALVQQEKYVADSNALLAQREMLVQIRNSIASL